jgi:hypothetical protein
VFRGLELPYSKNRKDYVALIKNLSNNDVPALFGLPENIEGSAQQTQSDGDAVLAVVPESLLSFVWAQRHPGMLINSARCVLTWLYVCSQR